MNKILQIYCYTQPDYPRHDGYCKIGQTVRTAGKRVKEQHNTADIEYKIEWIADVDGFTDKEFHAYLISLGIDQLRKTEFFKISPGLAREYLYKYAESKKSTITILRDEQRKAIDETKAYFDSCDKNSSFLWSAKPRFGKTLTAYKFCQEYDAKKILIITNRPTIATSWKDDFDKIGFSKNGYIFIDNPKKSSDIPATPDQNLVYFASLQNLKGSKYLSPDGKYDKLKEIADIKWDVLIIDEAHEGTDTCKANIVLSNIHADVTLHLTGTAFKSIHKDEFKDAVYSWTYLDEQKVKEDWSKKDPEHSPYRNLPKLSLTTYRLQNIIHPKSDYDIGSDEYVEYGYDLNNLFKANADGFIYDAEVDLFLDVISSNEKYPYSEKMRDLSDHSFWLLQNVPSVDALIKKLRTHPVFKNYYLVSVAGDGDDDSNEIEDGNMLKTVKDAIAKYPKTITLSVGRLTTGVTIPEWDTAMILCDVESREKYIQTMFRVQNPYVRPDNTIKEISHIYDFNQRNSLTIMESFANDLSINDPECNVLNQRKENVQNLLKYFDIFGEDQDGHINRLSRDDVITIPVEATADRVIRSQFTHSGLFENIDRIFAAPKEISEILDKISTTTKKKSDTPISDRIKSKKNQIKIKESLISKQIEDDNLKESLAEFDEKNNQEKYEKAIFTLCCSMFKAELSKNKNKDEILSRISKLISIKVKDYVKTIYEIYLDDLNRGIDDLNNQMNMEVSKLIEDVEEVKRSIPIFTFRRSQKIEEIEKDRDRRIQEIHNKYSIEISEFEKAQQDMFREYKAANAEEIVKKICSDVAALLNDSIAPTDEDVALIRESLRGFSRTIPAFVMAYGLNTGDNQIQLNNLEDFIPHDVFKEVTSISIEMFKLLRDGGDVINDDGEIVLNDSGAPIHFDGGVFNELIFDESIKKFIVLSKELSDYFDDENTTDIFDFIPLQKTNQKFTPKNIVSKMVDELEKNSPGCFDDPEKTFIDIYMKSGLFITEIIKRLYRSENMKMKFPDSKNRLKHIIENQVFGIAPSKIIFNIATNYIFSSDLLSDISRKNFKMLNYEESDIQSDPDKIQTAIINLMKEPD